MENNLNTVSIENNNIKQLCVDDICAFANPLTPVYDTNGIICDNIYIVLECPQMHIHNYYITDIYNKKSKCITCNSGNKFTTLVRNLLENTFKMPFIITTNKVNQNSKVEYINHILKLQIICCQTSIIQKPYIGNNILYLCVYPTTSLKRLSIQLFNQLKCFNNYFSPNITLQIQQLNIYNIQL